VRNSRQGTALAIMAALLLAVPATASAAGDLTSYITSVSPGQNAKLAFASKPELQVISTCKGMALVGYISRSATLDGESAFLGSDLQDQFPMPEVTFGSGVYSGAPQGTWLQQAGEYYWQVRAASAQCAGEPAIAWASQPVGIQVLGSTADSGTIDVSEQDNGELLTITQARETIGPAVLKAKKRSARGLKRTCTRRGSGSILAVICTASWNDRKKYSYNGSWRMALNDDGTVAATFNGRRALLSCVKRKRAKKQSVKGCFKKHKFAVTVS
jgi:hypothetical protein